MSDVQSSIASPGGRVAPAGTNRIVATVLVGVAVVVVAVVAVRWLVDGGVSRGDERLYGTIWVLESASLDDEPVDVTTPGQRGRWEFRFYMTDGEPGTSDTPVIVISDGCGQSTQELDLGKSTGRLSWWGYHGSASCAGAFADVMAALYRSKTFDYEIAGDYLLVSSDDAVAEVTLRSLNAGGR